MMKLKFRKIGLGLVAFAAVLVAIPAAQATSPGDGKYGSIYAVNPFGDVWRDPYGTCIHTPWWSADREAPECGGAIAVVPVTKELTFAAQALFGFDRYDLTPGGMATLDEFVNDLRKPEVESISSILVVGNTDSIGSEQYNQALSERRAATVANYLVQSGIDSSVITARGDGELNPVAPNTNPDGSDNPEGRAQNRRVDVTVETMEQVLGEQVR
jgi:OOP family OmpA-OmpF porin